MFFIRGVNITVEIVDAAASEIPGPSTLAIFTPGLLGLASRRFKKQT